MLSGHKMNVKKKIAKTKSNNTNSIIARLGYNYMHCNEMIPLS